MRGSSKWARWKVEVLRFGIMGCATKGASRMGICGRVFSHGQTVTSMVDSSTTIRNKEKEYLPGLMDASTKETGLMESNTEREIRYL